MRTSELDYDLPPELIAQRPLARRDDSRLLVYERAGGGVRHRRFRDLPAELSPGALVVVNDTRVVPARIPIEQPKGEVLLLEQVGDAEWLALARPTRKLLPGDRHGAVELGDDVAPAHGAGVRRGRGPLLHDQTVGRTTNGTGDVSQLSSSYLRTLDDSRRLRERAVEGWERFEGHPPHRPWVDLVKIACEKCGNVMVIKFGKMGHFLACSNYPECKYIKKEPPKETGESCPQCGSPLVEKRGRFGPFTGCSNYPECKFIKKKPKKEKEPAST